MKIFKLLFILLISWSSAASEQDSLCYSYQKWSVGINTGVQDFRPYFTYNIARHQIGAGVLIEKNAFGPFSGGSKQKVRGGNLFYRIYPFRPRESFSFYFENYLQYGRENLPNDDFYGFDQAYISNSILAAVRYRMFNRISIYTAFGRGASFYAGEVAFSFNLLFGFEVGIR